MSSSSKKQRRRQRDSEASTNPTPRTASNPPGTRSWHRWLPLLLLVLASGLAYGRLLGNDFINFDDDLYVTANPEVRSGWTARGVAWAFGSFHAANWHPLTWLSHMLDVELFGLDPAGHHAVNLLLHVLAAGLLFEVFRRLLANRWIAFFIAAVFALHPAHVESVAWVAERKDVLSAVFWMLTMLAWLCWVERPTVLRYGWVMLALALGLMAKPMLVTLPFVLLLLDVWPLGRWRGFAPADPLPENAVHAAGGARGLGRLVLEKLPLFGLVAASSVVTVFAQRAGGAIETFERLSVGQRLGNAVVGYGRYLDKVLAPRDLSLYYPLDWSHGGGPPIWQVLLSVLVLAVISILAWIWRRERPWWGLGWLWFLGTLVPVVGLVQVGAQAIADRYTYIPSIGLAWMVAGVLAEVAGETGKRRAVAAVGAGLLVVLGALTWRQVGYWHDSIRLFERSIAVTKNNYILQNNLGATYNDLGRPDKALPLLEATVAARPTYAEAQSNLGLAKMRTGDPRGAIEQYRKALELRPDDGPVLANLGEALAATGQLTEAVEVLHRAVDHGGGARAHNNLGNALAQTGDINGALEQYGKAIELDPGYAKAYANRANVLTATGRLEEAAKAYERSLELEPDNASTLTGYATVVADRGDLPRALTLLRRAVALDPSLAQARFFLGLGLLQSGDRDGAIEQYQRLTQLAPPLAEQLGGQIQAAP
ncbi:MAG: tetratricopeptide repeat protein [Acidobacteria bacterium]|nr:tetratricopeptide repeat protein [Acidobacteriota bacterium]